MARERHRATITNLDTNEALTVEANTTGELKESIRKVCEPLERQAPNPVADNPA